jgi:hypothetical protein
MEAIVLAQGKKGTYKSIYSDSTWPASHMLAALYKLQRPEVLWTADFSNPLTVDVNGQRRFGNVPAHCYFSELSEDIRERGITVPGHVDFHELVEMVVITLVDLLLVTKGNQ